MLFVEYLPHYGAIVVALWPVIAAITARSIAFSSQRTTLSDAIMVALIGFVLAALWPISLPILGVAFTVKTIMNRGDKP